MPQQPASSSTSVVRASDEVPNPGKAGAAAKSHEPAAATAAVVTLASAGAGKSNVLYSVSWSYDADPTGGSLTVQDGAAVWFKVDITAKGAGQFKWDPPLKGTAATAMVITLASGGGAVNGIVNAHAGIE